jgi:hypothetical protein
MRRDERRCQIGASSFDVLIDAPERPRGSHGTSCLRHQHVAGRIHQRRGRTPEGAVGDGGEKLHEWAIDAREERNRQLLENATADLGAVIAGRTTYDGVYTFVTGGITDALEQAQAAAGDDTVTVMGGAETGPAIHRRRPRRRDPDPPGARPLR